MGHWKFWFSQETPAGKRGKVSGLCGLCFWPYLIMMTSVGKEAFPSGKLDLSSLSPRGFPPHWELEQLGHGCCPVRGATCRGLLSIVRHCN